MEKKTVWDEFGNQENNIDSALLHVIHFSAKG